MKDYRERAWVIVGCRSLQMVTLDELRQNLLLQVCYTLGHTSGGLH